MASLLQMMRENSVKAIYFMDDKPSCQAWISALVAWFSVLPAFQLISGYCALNSASALSMLTIG